MRENPTIPYCRDMQRSMGSKLFWLPQVPLHEIGAVVDYGCADGSMLKAIHGVLPDGCFKAGVDCNPAMLRRAKANFVEGDLWTTSIGEAMEFVNDREEGTKSLLILSSVLHEVEDVHSLWWELEALRFDYIVIREMAVSSMLHLRPAPVNWIRAAQYMPIGEWGVLHDTARRHHCETLTTAAFLHGMLKAVHLRDYAEEAHENYLRMSAEDYERMFTSGPYYFEYAHRTCTPFFKRFCHERDVDFRECYPAPVTTHIELVLAR